MYLLLNLNHRLTLSKSHNSQTLIIAMHAKTVISLKNYSFGLNNFVYMSTTFLFNVFNGFYLHVSTPFFILGVNFLHLCDFISSRRLMKLKCIIYTRDTRCPTLYLRD